MILLKQVTMYFSFIFYLNLFFQEYKKSCDFYTILFEILMFDMNNTC
jgi:hypothetical protein